MKKDIRFGSKRFVNHVRELSDSGAVVPIAYVYVPPEFRDILDHGFVLHRARLFLREFVHDPPEAAIISRTYLDDRTSSLPGIAHFDLPTHPDYWGEDEMGTPVATIITEPTKESERLLQCYSCMPIDEITSVTPQLAPITIHGVVGSDLRLEWSAQGLRY